MAFITVNPADNLQVAVKKRPDEFRDAFDADDLKALFGSKEYRQDGFKRGYQFWTPIIALYTGCRIEEICQLHLDDIIQEDGLWVLDINDDDEKKLKNLSSKRLVPLHPVLGDELNLPAYAESLRAEGHSRLFPNLKQQRDGYSQNVSKWFGRYRKSCGVNSPKKTFHSFRHTFITAMKHKVANISILHELHGHALKGMTITRYGKKYPPRVLYDEAISKLDYKFDLGPLHVSRYI
jgi:integrase